MAQEASELELFIDNTNTPQAYQMQQNIFRKLVGFKLRGTYTTEGAIKALGYLADSGAKAYVKELRTGTKWSTEFPPAVRKEYAKTAEADFVDLYDGGELDDMKTKGKALLPGIKAGKTSRKKYNWDKLTDRHYHLQLPSGRTYMAHNIAGQKWCVFVKVENTDKSKKISCGSGTAAAAKKLAQSHFETSR